LKDRCENNFNMTYNISVGAKSRINYKTTLTRQSIEITYRELEIPRMELEIL
jgi:hypothetical protein